MSLTLEQKKAIAADLSERVQNAQAIMLAEYRGLTVSQMTDFRSKAKDSGVHVQVLKNTVARRVVEDSDYKALTPYFIGPIVVGISEDPVAAAKLFDTGASDYNKLVIKAGAMNGELLDEAGVKALAKLPGRQELLGKLVVVMNQPAQKAVQTLNEIPTAFVRALAAIRDQKAA